MKVGSTEFIFRVGDITKEQVDVIVNAANCTLTGGGGVDGAIHKAGGPSIMAELKQIIARIKKCPTGEAVITGPGRLKSQYIVHAVGPIWSGGKKDEPELLESAYYNSLIIAKEYGAKTVALPAISTGAYNYPTELAASIALKTSSEFCSNHNCFTELRFILFTSEMLTVYEKASKDLDHHPG